ncbi:MULTISPECIES: XF1762 family protein [unclassified Streptomyces]|uniref:XF1762 family protein n=1 Tax=unclassified Streptomyces TaxID=2593676 RepID=UPI002E17B017|nr:MULTISPECIES: XF1762 family protein [unclassified Streptomyces]
MSDARLHLVPVRSREAKDFVRAWHRHHPPPAGQIFAVGAADESGTLRAVAIVGRPVARHFDDGATLEDMTTRDAVDAVASDVRDHHITLDGTGLFNATRHIDLLCHLTARMAAEAEYQLAPNIADLPPARTLGASAGHLGQAIAHYTQALAPLITLTTAKQDTLQQKLDALGHHSSLRVHLDGASRALAAARTALKVQQPLPAASAPAPAPLRDSTRRRA